MSCFLEHRYSIVDSDYLEHQRSAAHDKDIQIDKPRNGLERAFFYKRNNHSERNGEKKRKEENFQRREQIFCDNTDTIQNIIEMQIIHLIKTYSFNYTISAQKKQGKKQ